MTPWTAGSVTVTFYLVECTSLSW